MKAQVYGNSLRTSLICIDGYENNIPRGRIYNNYLGTGVEFVGVMELLKTIETLVETMNCPQAFSERRMFTAQTTPISSSMLYDDINGGEMATFSVRLLFRQNASWQGSVLWHEGNTEESFRSVLELLLLIDSAMN
ncbi:MAG: hypothetical protein J6L23_01645 [Clostridia bacterium]|nr:hypothetical protein [Clostridia bacterium]